MSAQTEFLLRETCDQLLAACEAALEAANRYQGQVLYNAEWEAMRKKLAAVIAKAKGSAP